MRTNRIAPGPGVYGSIRYCFIENNNIIIESEISEAIKAKRIGVYDNQLWINEYDEIVIGRINKFI